jgi:hypothetical protein
MKNINSDLSTQDQIGKRFAQALDQNSVLSYEVTERLRAARMRALSMRRIAQPQLETAQDIQSQNGLALMKFPAQFQLFFQTFGSIIPLLVLVAGLIFIHDFHNNQTAIELAEIDSALLTDDLPPNAYTDASFLDYLKHDIGSPQNQ